MVDHGRVIRCSELSDSGRGFVRSLLPESLRGRRPLNDRNALNGVARKFRTGAPWRDVPERYDRGPRCTPVSTAEPRTAPSSGCSGRPRRKEMRLTSVSTTLVINTVRPRFLR
ncbi:transposase [Streptomyces atratus]|uniref:transposase n=1 Tax=Streptomyces TaxID=1883 RepID=UPI0037A2C7F1